MKRNRILQIASLLWITCALPAAAFDLAPQALEAQSPTRESNPETGNIYEESPLEGIVFGRVRSTLTMNQVSNNGVDSSYFNTKTDARLGYTVKAKSGGWTTSGTIDLELSTLGAAGRTTTASGCTVSCEVTHPNESVQTSYLYVTIENEQYSFRLGRQEPGGSTLGGKYLQNIDSSLAIGETITSGDFFTLEFKDYGLKYVTGLHAATDDNTPDGVATNDEIVQALFFEGSSGDFGYTFSGTRIDEKTSQQTTAALTHSPEIYTGIAGAVSMEVGDWSLALNLDKFYLKHLNGTTPNENTMTQILIFDHKLGVDQGYTIAFSNQDANLGNASNTLYTSADFSYTYSIGLMRIYAAINNSTTKTEGSTDKNITQYGIGMSAHFK